MNKVIPLVLIIFGVALVLGAAYSAINPSTQAGTASLLKTIGIIVGFLLGAGTSIKGWLDLFKKDEKIGKTTKFEVKSGSPQIATGENARNIQTSGGDYIEKIEISLSIQDEEETSKRRTISRIPAVERTEKITPFLIGVVLDLSKTVFDSIYDLSEQDEDFFQRLLKALNRLVNKAISYCEHPHSKDILPRFSLFFYGFGLGNVLKGLDSFARRLGLVSDVQVSDEPVRDLLKLAADNEGLPITPNAAELNKYWKTYRTSILAQYPDMEFNDAPLIEALKIAQTRIQNELAKKSYQSPLILLITSGKFTDGNYADLLAIANEIKKEQTTLVIGYLGEMDILEARTLYNRDNPDWDREAKILFSCASELDKTGKIGKSILEMAIEKSWIIPDKAKLFLQINQQQMMEEIIDIITSPLRD